MRIKCRVALIFPVAGLLILSGCISFKSHPAGIEASGRYLYSPDYEVLGDAEGISSSFRLFWFLPVTSEASYREAVDDAIRSKGGDNIIEAVFTRENRVYIVGTVTIIYVNGKVIRYIRDKNLK